MFMLRRSPSRWLWPIAIGSILIVTLCLLLAALSAAPASATPGISNQTSAQLSSSTISLALLKTATPITIPVGSAPTKLDGFCDPASEWSGARVFTYTDTAGAIGKVYLKHDNANLYVCLQGATSQSPARFASVYLDTLDTRKPLAGPTDYGLRVDIVTGTASINSVKGNGIGGYVPTTLSGWTAGTVGGVGVGFDGAEYQISLALTGGACGQPFGLSVRHQQVVNASDDFGWPDGGAFNKPDTWQEVQLDQQTCGRGKIAYVYRRDTATAGDFKNLLEGAGFTVQLIPQSVVTATDFSVFNLTIIADDTGSLDQWGGISVTPIISPNKPIIGLGEGGYAFFGRVPSPIGWPNGWHGPQANVLDLGALPVYYLSPNNLSGLLPGPFPIYGAPGNEVGIFMPAVPASVIPIGWEPPSTPTGNPDHASLTLDGCYHLWGFSGGPNQMNGSGQNLFLNAVTYLIPFQCPPRTTPPPDCVTLVKTAVPPSGSTVQPGDAITYTLSYTVTDSVACTAQRALLTDKVPDHTLFVPGSASDGKTPNIEHTLTWDLSPLTPGKIGSKSFTVSALDTACRQHVITNTTKLQTELGIFTSNTTTHNVNCPPVIPPNNDPPYAESEIQVYPYPLVTGAPTQFSVRVFNNSATTQTVTVTFQTSPNNFGIGIPFGTLPVPGNPRVVTIGPLGYAEVQINWTPDRSGHYCIAVKIESPGYQPIYTYRNLDVAEDLKPGVTDVLTFSVANPTLVTATINLVVVNTCPGWTAVVNPPSIVAEPGKIYTATLSVTPPNPAVLGTACHIDVQGWIGDRLIGGIRKLDVPPVNLPHSDPPWLEKEITTVPTPPISGTVNHVYIELNNPWPFQRVVTVTFSEAVFGAGIPFTPFITQVFTLPANSLQKYGVPWTPIPSASLHRCILVTLQQPGFQNQTSQRNVDLQRRPPIGWNPGGVRIPFSIGNPFPFTSTLNLNGILIGLNNWMPKFVGPGGGDPPPDLPPGGMWNGELMLVPAVMPAAPQNAPQNAPQATDVSLSGDAVRVDVSVNLNDQPYSGFSVDFAPPLSVYLPLIRK